MEETTPGREPGRRTGRCVLPTGTVTFLFTDIEGSTRLWEADPAGMQISVARHDALVREAAGAHDGEVFKTVGDAFHVAFERPLDAIAAAIAAQRLLHAEPWGPPSPIRARMAIHTGVAEVRDGDYFGQVLNRLARILAVGHGGQTLVSAATSGLVRGELPAGMALRDLGERRLKDLERAERVFQLDADGLPSDFDELTSLEAIPNDLPLQLTSFIGRETELEEVRRLLAQSRLVTLVGAGGAGKTRLALQVAVEVLERFPDGAFFVDLAGLSDGSLVAQAVGRSARLHGGGVGIDAASLAAQLRDRRMLIVMDNCEHVIAACAEIADAVVRGASGITILATSREPLRVLGEMVYPVPSLAETAAVRLFTERAAAVSTAFRTTQDNAAAVAEIVRRLDGIPLAIELAAARIPVLTPGEIASRLDDRFRLLRAGARTLLPRQQTLWALIDWSHDLLSEDERLLFRRLGVFAGSWTLEAAESVTTGPPAAAETLAVGDVLEILAGLVAKSLIVTDVSDVTRYRMLESIRVFARERLAASGEEPHVASRHLAWFLALARAAEPELVGSRQRDWFDRLAVEHDNLRVALRWGLDHEPRSALEIAKALYWFWQARGHTGEGRGWLDVGLDSADAAPRDALRQSALLGAGSLAWAMGDYPAARRQLGESAEIARDLGDGRARAIALTILAQTMIDDDDHASARTVLAESIALARGTGDAFVLGRSLGALADLARREGHVDETVDVTGEAISVFERIGMHEGIAFNHYYRAYARRHVDAASARDDARRAVELFARIDHPHGLHLALMLLVNLATPAPESAARLVGAIDVLRERGGLRDATADRSRTFARIRADARDLLGEDRFAALTAEGRTLAPSAVVDLALQVSRSSD